MRQSMRLVRWLSIGAMSLLVVGVLPAAAATVTTAEIGNLTIAGTSAATTQCAAGATVTGIVVHTDTSDGDVTGLELHCTDGTTSPPVGGNSDHDHTVDFSDCPSGYLADGVSVSWGERLGGLGATCSDGTNEQVLPRVGSGDRANSQFDECPGVTVLAGMRVRWATYPTLAASLEEVRSVAVICASVTARIGNTVPPLVSQPGVASTECPSATFATGADVNTDNATGFVTGARLTCSDGSTSDLAGAPGTVSTGTCVGRMVGIYGKSGDIENELGVRCLDAAGNLVAGSEFGASGGSDVGPADCPAATSLVGLVVWTGTYFGRSVATSLRGVCAPTPTTASLGDKSSNDAVASVQCPAGTYVTGLFVHTIDDDASLVVDAAALKCGAAGSSITIGTVSEGDTVTPSPCRSGDPAIGVYGAAGAANDSLGTVCDGLSGTYDAAEVGGSGGDSKGPRTCPAGGVMIGLTMTSLPLDLDVVSGSVTVICSAPATTTTASVPASRFRGAPVTVRAAVTSATDIGAATGFVDFYRDGVLVARVALAKGVAHYPTVAPKAQSSIVAVYEGDAHHSRSVADPVSITATATDTHPPTASLAALSTATLASAVILHLSGADAGSGIDHFQLRSRFALDTKGFTAWTTPTVWKHLTTTVARATGLLQGGTYCYAVRATDRVGHQSPWSKQVCTARPIDDRALTASKGWSRSTSKVFWNGTATTSSKKGVTLTRAGVHLNTVGVLATTCPTCGTITISVGNTKIGRVNLHASSTQRRVLRLLPPFSQRIGAVHITVTSRGKRVQVDGVFSLES